jgi:hypothetical protein
MPLHYYLEEALQYRLRPPGRIRPQDLLTVLRDLAARRRRATTLPTYRLLIFRLQPWRQ